MRTAAILAAIEEQWARIVGFDMYFVSRTGKVLSLWHANPRLLALVPSSRGYATVRLVANKGEKAANRPVHHLVAEAFIGPRPEVDQEIRHLDGNKLNNHVDNLKYGSRSENRWDSVRHGTHAQINKTHCPQGHPYDAANTVTSVAGHRRCRTCKRASDRRPVAEIAVFA